MQHKKQPAIDRTCPHCGATMRGKYAAKNHICRASMTVQSRDAGLAAQRKDTNPRPRRSLNPTGAGK